MLEVSLLTKHYYAKTENNIPAVKGITSTVT